MNQRADGTYIFAAPLGKSRISKVTLSDIGFFARYIFNHREAASGQQLEIASDMVDWPYLVSNFVKVAGKPAVYVPLSIDEWVDLWHEDDLDRPFAKEGRDSEAAANWRQFLYGWWPPFHAEGL